MAPEGIGDRMSRIQELFFFLLKRGLWGDKQTPDEGLFPATSSEWMLLYRLSRKHTVQGIVYDGICTLPVGCQPPKMLLIYFHRPLDKQHLRWHLYPACRLSAPEDAAYPMGGGNR